MSDHDGTQVSTLRPTGNDNKEAWKDYWKTRGQPWRTEPEIEEKRQIFLAERRSISSDIEQRIYPFKDIEMSRADVEWLLVTHENGLGPVDWSDESQRQREGVDLRGADLRQVNLTGLPLARVRAGLIVRTREPSEEQRSMAAAHLEKANLQKAQLQGANLAGALLQRAYLGEAQLQEANLDGALLQKVSLYRAQLQEAYLREAQFQGADLRKTGLEHATLDQVMFSDQTRLADISWGEINLAVIDWGLVTRLGDEQVAHQKKDSQGKTKVKQARVDEYKEAVRANRQLAVILRDQGLNEEADHFAYRAQMLQRTVWRIQGRPLKFLLSWFLFMLAGYGYRPLRSLLWYLVIIIGFAAVYHTVNFDIKLLVFWQLVC